MYKYLLIFTIFCQNILDVNSKKVKGTLITNKVRKSKMYIYRLYSF